MPASKAGIHSENKQRTASDERRGRGRPARLSREKILEAARTFRPEDLTVPGLAKALGVPTSSLYHHIDSREDVLLQLARESATKLEFPPADPANWKQWLRKAAFCLLDFHKEYLLSTDGKMGSAANSAAFEPFLETLEEAGFTSEQAIYITNAIAGWVLSASSAHQQLKEYGGKAGFAKAAREQIAEIDPGTAPRTYKVLPVLLAMDRDRMLSMHLDWLIDGIPVPKK